MKIKNLTIKIGEEEILKDVSFQIIPQKLNLIVGRNGAGKTVLLDRLSGLNRFYSEFEGFPKTTEIIYQTQGVPFIYEATVEQTLKLIGDLSGDKNNLLDSAPEKVKRNFSKCFGKLSSGERRFLIIWAILNIDKKLYLFDEPFANLDISIIKDIIELIYQKVDDGRTIVTTTHQFEFFENEKTRVIVLNEGKILFEGSLEKFYKKYLSFQNLFDNYLTK